MMGNVYLFCLALGFTFTVVGALLGGLLGGHDGGGHDAGTGHDISGGEFEAAHGADAGHGDGHVGIEDGSMHLPLLSPTVLSFLVASFGGAGLIYRSVFGERPWIHAPLAGVTAAAMALAMAFGIWKITSTFESNRNARVTDVLGTLAEVSISVPKEGAGEIAYVSGGTRQTLSARSSDGKAHKQGQKVKVLRVADGIAWVSEALPGEMAAVSSPSSVLEEPGVGQPVRDRDRS